jgi:hypothetical protein
VATDALPQRSLSVGRADALAAAAYALGAISLAGEGAVHIQQYASLLHGVRWVGPLFLANAVACVAAIIALTYGRARALAALAERVSSHGRCPCPSPRPCSRRQTARTTRLRTR